MAEMTTWMAKKELTSNDSPSCKTDATVSIETNSVVSTDTSECSTVDATPIKDGNPLLKIWYCFDQTPISSMKKGKIPFAFKEECKEECREESIPLKYAQARPTVLFEEREDEKEEVESCVVKERELKVQVTKEEEQVKTHQNVDRLVLAFEVVLLMAIVLYAAYPYLKETPAGEYLSSKGAEAVAMIASTPIFEWVQRVYAQLLDSVHDKTTGATIWAMGVSETTFERLEQMYPGSRNYISGFLMHVHLDWIVVKPAPPPVKVTHKILRFLRALLLPKARPQAPVDNKTPGKFVKFVKSALAGPISEDSVQDLFPKSAAIGTSTVVSKPPPKTFRWIKTAFRQSK
jgi:hypothetical protein